MPNVIRYPLVQAPYAAMWDKQEELLQRGVERKTRNRREGARLYVENHFLFVEHPPVFTLGKAGDMNHLLVSDALRAARGIDFFKINRGGDITFHGPGQLVGYPILDLEQFKPDLHIYLRDLEEVIIRTLADYGLSGERVPEYTGVWLDAAVPERARKICAIGVRAKRWITMHGFALNVTTDLSYFELIVPCGITDRAVTSLEAELGYKIPLPEVAERVQVHFESVFSIRWQLVRS